MKYTPKTPVENNVTKGHPLTNFIKISLSAAALIGVLYGTLFVIFSYGAQFIPQVALNMLSEGVLKSLKEPTLDYSARLQFIEELINSSSLPEDLKIQIKVKAYEDSHPQALSLPNGTLLFSTAFLQSVQSVNELYFVLFHEIGHYKLRHYEARLGQLFTSLVLSSLSISTLSQEGLNLGFLANSRSQEAESDQFAVEHVVTRYQHLGHSLKFFERVQTLGIQSQKRRFQSFLSTHPLPPDRIQKLEKWGQENNIPLTGPAEDLPSSF